MNKYSYEYRKNGFPTSYINMPTFLDVTDSAASMINSIQDLRNAGKYEEAAEKINIYGDAIRPYIIDANTINTIIEEIRNTQIKCLLETQTIYIQDENPGNLCLNDVWIGTEEPIWEATNEI